MLRITTGKFKGKHLKLPPESITRPSSDRLRQAVFNILSNMMSFNGIHVLDGFAGSGAFGLEALSRGAAEVVFCENNPLVQKVLKENIENTVKANYQNLTIASDLFGLKPVCPFDIVFLDPPYDQGLEHKALEYLCNQRLIALGGIVVVEQRKGVVMIEPPEFITQAPRVYGNCQITVLQFNPAG